MYIKPFMKPNLERMQITASTRKTILIYLALVPFAAIIIAFALGHSNYKVYLPIWILHSCLLFAAAWVLGLRMIGGPDIEKKHMAVVALFMIVPWIFITIFAGMGPPPSTIPGWLTTAAEQQIRYIILIVAGLLFTSGFVLLREQLRQRGENLYSLLGLTFILIKMPLYILDMLYLGDYRLELYRIFAASGTDKRPDWPLPFRELFYSIGMVEVALTYLATAAFAVALRKTGFIKAGSRRIYVLLSFVGFVLALLPASVPDPLAIPSYLVCIPAVTFIIPYFFAINLLHRAES